MVIGDLVHRTSTPGAPSAGSSGWARRSGPRSSPGSASGRQLCPFVGLAWLELVSPSSGEAATLALAALVYTTLMVAAMAYAGRETGLAGFDLFTPYNRLFSAISTFGAQGRTGTSCGEAGCGR